MALALPGPVAGRTAEEGIRLVAEGVGWWVWVWGVGGVRVVGGMGWGV